MQLHKMCAICDLIFELLLLFVLRFYGYSDVYLLHIIKKGPWPESFSDNLFFKIHLKQTLATINRVTIN